MVLSILLTHFNRAYYFNWENTKNYKTNRLGYVIATIIRRPSIFRMINKYNNPNFIYYYRPRASAVPALHYWMWQHKKEHEIFINFTCFPTKNLTPMELLVLHLLSELTTVHIQIAVALVQKNVIYFLRRNSQYSVFSVNVYNSGLIMCTLNNAHEKSSVVLKWHKYMKYRPTRKIYLLLGKLYIIHDIPTNFRLTTDPTWYQLRQQLLI